VEETKIQQPILNRKSISHNTACRQSNRPKAMLTGVQCSKANTPSEVVRKL